MSKITKEKKQTKDKIFIPQRELIDIISVDYEMAKSDIQRVLDATDDTISFWLAQATDGNDITIKLFNGLTLHSRFVPEQQISKGMYQDHLCKKHLIVDASISRTYAANVNKCQRDILNGEYFTRK